MWLHKDLVSMDIVGLHMAYLVSMVTRGIPCFRGHYGITHGIPGIYLNPPPLKQSLKLAGTVILFIYVILAFSYGAGNNSGEWSSR